MMGREVRKIPVGWDHPRDEYGHLDPLFDDQMPQVKDGDPFLLCMYETCTEGTPISPGFETAEELARWLADTGASAFGPQTASYDAWLATIHRGWAPSAMIRPGHGMQSGVEALND